MPKQGAWCLHIALELKSEFVDKFLLKFAELARHVEANEPDTLSYEMPKRPNTEQLSSWKGARKKNTWRTCTRRRNV